MSNKRANPFVDDFVPQSKVHVGIKQYNNNEDRLRKVYEKTLKMLFRGATKVPTPNNNLHTDDCTKTDHLKQLFIGKDGTLMHTGVIVADCKEKLCKCGNVIAEWCSYCDSPLCEPCRLRCGSCKQFYCSKCTLTGSEADEICVSCYT